MKTKSIKSLERKLMSLERDLELIEMNESFDYDEYSLYDPEYIYSESRYDLYAEYYYKSLQYDVAYATLSILLDK